MSSALSKGNGIATALEIAKAGTRYGVIVYPDVPGRTHSGSFSQPAPLGIEVIDAKGESAWLMGGYDTHVKTETGLKCGGALKSKNGTLFHIVDDYCRLSGAIELTRTVTIESPSPEDKAFNSQFSLVPDAPTRLTDDDVFMPGNWYKQNEHVPKTALASSLEDRYYYIREDRLPLPMVAVRDRRSGITLTLAHLDANGATIPGEDGLDRIVDSRLQFGSLGLLNTDRPSPVFLFPGTEGERTYTYGGSPDRGRWAYRSHPVEARVPHSYRLLIRLAKTPSFAAAVKDSWRVVYDQAKPPVIKADLEKVYKASMDLLAEYIHPYEGVISVPFASKIPDGTVSDTSSEMGFVGQAMPSAALLLRYGLETNNTAATEHATAVVDFWAENCLSSGGVPRTWYDIHPGGKVTWRDYHTFLRTTSDGLDGALQAWNELRRHGQDRPKWLAFCRTYGDWLLKVQNADGSWAREYDFDSHVVNAAKDTTDQPVPFLINLYKATGDARYRDAALTAGEFCLKTVHDGYAYVGGTPDNPNVLDKEGGMMALAAFLALYDVNGDRRWLDAAAQAAQYCETWVYCWNIPIPESDPKVVYPRSRTTLGVSLIATGHSGSDNYMAGAPFMFYRLYLLTGDRHFLDVSRMLLHDTKQMLDWDGTLGYKYPGLLSEALTLPPLRGHGVEHWLPWLTVAVLDPLTHLQDVFGSMDIDQIEKLPNAERLKRNAAFARSHGFEGAKTDASIR